MAEWTIRQVLKDAGRGLVEGFPAAGPLLALSALAWWGGLISASGAVWAGIGAVQVVLLCLMASAVLGKGGWRTLSPMRALQHAPVSLALVGFILIFVAIMTLLALTLLVLAIRAGAGYDFSADPAVAEAAYANSPARQLEYVALCVALLVTGAGIARALPVLAASIEERRILAIEAFNSTKGKGVRLLVSALIVLALPIALVALGTWMSGKATGSALLALGLALCLYGFAALSQAARLATLRASGKLSNPS